jgi:protein-S-isoprenylcysteine O-methyltransferase Ste14
MIPRKALMLSLCLLVLDHGHAFQLPSFTRPIQVGQSNHLLPTTSTALSSPIVLSKSRPSFVTTTRLESVPTEIWTCVLPPFLGLYKSEYGVSYAYGTATALSAYLLAKTLAPTATLPYWHAAALILYGVRLNVFLAVRTAMSKRMQEMVQTIEDRAIARGNRLSRLPFILSCGLLYYGLVAPVVATSQLTIDSTITKVVFAGLVGMQWFGFSMAALGDFTKTYVKSKQKEDHFLVTSGIYSIVRHPNYTGEIIAWTANAALGLMGAFLLRGKWSLTQLIANVASNLVGWMGIVLVLLRATSGLETRQEEKYGEVTKYKEWVQSTWSGWTMASIKGPNNAPAQEETHHLEVTDVDEGMGSGI